MKLRLRFGHWYCRRFNIDAITLYPYILFREEADVVSLRTIKHELIHFNQVRREGWLKFYAQYILFMIVGMRREWAEGGTLTQKFWRAYRANPYEVEAYDCDKHGITFDDATLLSGTILENRHGYLR